MIVFQSDVFIIEERRQSSLEWTIYSTSAERSFYWLLMEARISGALDATLCKVVAMIGVAWNGLSTRLLQRGELVLIFGGRQQALVDGDATL